MSKREFMFSFKYNGNLYEVFNNNGKVDILKIGKNNTTKEQDEELCKLILLNLYQSTMLEYDTVNYNGSTFKVLYNELNKLFSFKKLNDDAPITEEEFKFLDNKYNHPVYDYNYNNYGSYGSNFDDDFNFGSTGYTSPYDQGYNYRKKREQRRKKLIALGLTGTLILSMSATAVIGYFNGWFKRDKDAINEKPNTSITEVEPIPTETPNIGFGDVTEVEISTYSFEDIEAQIREYLAGEEEWIIEYAIEEAKQFYDFQNGIFPEEAEEKTVSTENYSNKTITLLNLIKENNNFTNEEKRVLIENYGTFFENNLKYFDDNAYEDICEIIKTMSVERKYTDSGYIIGDSNLKVAGQYYGDSNTIALYCKDESVLTHEFMHALGRFQVFSGRSNHDLFSEGWTEMNNPLRRGGTYSVEQTVIVMLSEIYGKDFLMHSYYSSNLFLDLRNLDPNNTDIGLEDWHTIQEMNNQLELLNGLSIDQINSNEESRNILLGVINTLQTLYENNTGLKWEDNRIILACLDRVLRTNYLGLADGIIVDDIYFDKDGSIKITQTKEIEYSYNDSPFTYVSTTTHPRQDVEIGRGR